MSIIARMTLGLMLVSPSFAFAQDTGLCDVPVCSVQDTIANLRSMTGDQRGMYALNLLNQHKNETELRVLENLRQAGLEMKALFAELGDEDWVQRAAADLVNISVFNLSKNIKVDGERLGELYQQLSNQTYRYNMISYWHGKLKTIEDSSVIEELILFADIARNHSTKAGDEDWVPRAAGSLISDATVKLIHLDPSHEGLYQVEVHGALKYMAALAFDRIAVLDSSSSKNLMVVMINTRLKAIVHSFSHAEIIGNTISGTVFANGEVPGRFNMTINRQNSSLEGIVETTRDGVIHFSGKQLVSTRTVFEGAGRDLSEKDILGTMEGVLGGVKGKLTVKSFKEDIYSATFASHNGSIIMNFQGKYFPKKGVLSLTSNEKVKLTISLRQGIWSGFSFSTVTGTHAPAEFKPVR